MEMECLKAYQSGDSDEGESGGRQEVGKRRRLSRCCRSTRITLHCMYVEATEKGSPPVATRPHPPPATRRLACLPCSRSPPCTAAAELEEDDAAEEDAAPKALWDDPAAGATAQAPPPPPASLLPPAAAVLDGSWAPPTAHQQQQMVAALHQGRTRSFPHRHGCYPTHVCFTGGPGLHHTAAARCPSVLLAVRTPSSCPSSPPHLLPLNPPLPPCGSSHPSLVPTRPGGPAAAAARL